VAAIKTSKLKRDNVFGVFTPSRNYYFQGLSATDTVDWVEKLRSEAHVDALEEQMILSPHAQQDINDSLSEQENEDRSSSPEPIPANLRISRKRGGTHTSTGPRQVSQSHDFSGNEMNSYSDSSDTPGPSESTPAYKSGNVTSTTRPGVGRNTSQMSGFDTQNDPERVVFHGYLYYLKTKGGVRQWKKLWVVLRPKNLAFYKNDQVCLPIPPSNAAPLLTS
jgi:hypothetical protein